MKIVLGVGAKPEDAPAAKGTQIFYPPTSSLCGFDLALIQLDKDVPDAKIAEVRFGELRVDEALTAVGYGADEKEELPAKRMQRDTTLLGVGPKDLRYTTKDKTEIDYTVAAGDFATGESTCWGDSGGPIFDTKGAVVGLTSRGVPGTSACTDLPSINTGVREHEQTIRQAAQTAGHPLP